MRRKASQLPDRDAWDLLQNGIWGTLATVDSNGQPYAVPMNYALLGTTLYLHSAMEGHKIDNLHENPRVSFSVVATAEVLSEQFDMTYRSVVVFGTARIIKDTKEKRPALEALMEKYSPAFHDKAMEYISSNIGRTAVIAVEISAIAAKTGR